MDKKKTKKELEEESAPAPAPAPTFRTTPTGLVPLPPAPAPTPMLQSESSFPSNAAQSEYGVLGLGPKTSAPLPPNNTSAVVPLRIGVSSTTPAMAMLAPAAEAVARPAAPPAPAPAAPETPSNRIASPEAETSMEAGLASIPTQKAVRGTDSIYGNNQLRERVSGGISTGQSAYKPNSNSILPDVLSERTQDIGKSVDQKFTDKLAEDKKAAQAAQDARIANLQTIKTPYGEIKATPEQAARFNKSPEMVQVEIDALKKAPYGGKPLTDEERKNLPPAEFDRRVKEASAPITRAEMDNREARIRELENKRNRLAGEARDNAYLDRMEMLRKNREAAIKQNPQLAGIPSVIDQTSAVSPAYTGKSNQEVPAWFQSRLDSFQPMSGGGAGSDEVEREVRKREAAERGIRQAYLRRKGTLLGAPVKDTTAQIRGDVVGELVGKRRVKTASVEARAELERANAANEELIKEYGAVAPDLNKEDVQELIDKLGPEKAQSFLKKLRAKSEMGRQ